MSVFVSSFLNEFFVNVHKFERDNWDHMRFAQDHPRRTRFMVNDAVIWMEAVIEKKEHFEKAFDLFHDEDSRKLMIRLLLYNILDHHHVRLPLNTDGFLEEYGNID